MLTAVWTWNRNENKENATQNSWEREGNWDCCSLKPGWTSADLRLHCSRSLIQTCLDALAFIDGICHWFWKLVLFLKLLEHYRTVWTLLNFQQSSDSSASSARLLNFVEPAKRCWTCWTFWTCLNVLNVSELCWACWTLLNVLNFAERAERCWTC